MSIQRVIAIGGIGLLLGPALCFAQVASDTPQQIAEYSRKIQQYLQEKKPELAIPELQGLVALDPNNADARGNLGVLLFFKGNCADATPQLRAATNLRTGLWRVEVLLSICEKRQGDIAAARIDLENTFPHLDDEKLRQEAGMELIEIYSGTGDLDKAAGVVTVLREHDPTNLDVLYTAYRIYMDLAGESMLSLSLVDPDSAQMHRMIAHEEKRQGNNARAIAQYRKAIALDPKLPGIHFELAELLYASQNEKDKKEAEQEYLAALAENHEDQKTVRKLAEIDAQKGNTQQAFAGFTRAVQLQPRDTDAKLGLAKTLIDMNQLDKAQALLEETVQEEPSNAICHYRLATLYRKIGRMDDAKREVEIYKKYKDMKEKLRTLYKELQIQPEETPADVQDGK
jgi:tetratricopeptide (TPR) repeat protein